MHVNALPRGSSVGRISGLTRLELDAHASRVIGSYWDASNLPRYLVTLSSRGNYGIRANVLDDSAFIPASSFTGNCLTQVEGEHYVSTQTTFTCD